MSVIWNNWRFITSSCISTIVIVHNLLASLINGTIGWKSASTTNIFHGIPKVCLKSTKNKCQMIRTNTVKLGTISSLVAPHK